MRYACKQSFSKNVYLKFKCSDGCALGEKKWRSRSHSLQENGAALPLFHNKRSALRLPLLLTLLSENTEHRLYSNDLYMLFLTSLIVAIRYVFYRMSRCLNDPINGINIW